MDNDALGVTLAAAAGAIAASLAARARPLLSLGILFALASASRVTVETAAGTMRLEQPGIALVAVVLLLGGSWPIVGSAPRIVRMAAGAFGGYLLVLLVASAFLPPDPLASLRLVAWQAISMAAGPLAFVLARRARVRTVETLAVGGALTGFVGVAVAVVFFVLGPGAGIGIQDAGAITPRVFGWSHEANLFASFLAICAPFAIEAARGSRRWLIVVLLVIGGLPFGETRGAYLGLLAGITAYIGVRMAVERRLTLARVMAVGVSAAFVIGTVGASFLLPNAIERYVADTRGVLEPSEGATREPGSPGSGTARPSLSATPSPTHRPAPTLIPPGDTLAFRFERVPIALEDLRMSPIIGLGLGSFGQRHGDPTQDGLPDHLAILVVATLHDSGLLGSAALLLGFGLIGRGLWVTARAAKQAGDRATVGTAAAFAGSIAAMLVAYEATNALHFAINWIIIGAAAAVIVPAEPASRRAEAS